MTKKGARLGVAVVVVGTLCVTAMVGPTSPAQALEARCAGVAGYAHRGGSDVGTHSRNTLPNFRDAFGAGMDGLETDVRPDADLDLVIYHNRAVDGVTDGTGNVDDLSTQYIESLHTHDGGRIPMYSEFLNLLANRPGKLAIVEIKPSAHWTRELFASALIKPVVSRGLLNRVVFDSAVNRYLPILDDIDPRVETAVKGASQRTGQQVLNVADSVVTRWDWPSEYVQQVQAGGGRVVLSAGSSRAWSSALSRGPDGLLADPAAALLTWCG